MTALPRRQLAVALAPRDTTAAIEQLARVARVADLAELRLDLMESFELAPLLRARPCPVIVTYRPVQEGGRYAGDEAARLAVLAEAAALGADYLDVELSAAPRLTERGASRLIVSHHDLEDTPRDLADWWRRLRATGADVVKLVGTARDPRDNLRMLALLAEADAPTVALCMGPLGLPSRILCAREDACFLTFAALDAGGGTAAGQLSVRVMREVYRVGALGPGTQVYGTLGHDGSNPSAEWLTTSLRARGADAVVVPWPLVDDPGALLAAARGVVRGFAVSSAWQRAAFRAAVVVDGPARAHERCDALAATRDGYEGRWLGSAEAIAAWWSEREWAAA